LASSSCYCGIDRRRRATAASAVAHAQCRDEGGLRDVDLAELASLRFAYL
jgi:hypothetical protein